jgi:mono/diheme cytochrome c family protein
MPIRAALTTATAAALLLGCAQIYAPEPHGLPRGMAIFAAECSQCHATDGAGGGAASLGLGTVPPDLTGLTARNDGVFPRAFVRRFVLGTIEKEDPDAAMPQFGTVGLKHVYPDGTDSVQLLSSDLDALLDYLETLQQ